MNTNETNTAKVNKKRYSSNTLDLVIAAAITVSLCVIAFYNKKKAREKTSKE